MRQVLIIVALLAAVVTAVAFVFTLYERPVEEPACALGECPLELHQSDSGKSFVYGVSTRFQILLNERENPKSRLTVSCTPTDAIGSVSNTPAAPNPAFYFVRFETVAPGICDLRNEHFQVRIIVRAAER